MYSEENAKLTLSNGSIVSAYITAIKMDVNLPTLKEQRQIVDSIIYDGLPLSEAMAYKQYTTADGNVHNGTIGNRFGIIGMLNVRTCTSQNEWTLIYVSEDASASNTPIVDAEGKHIYDAIEYMAYAS